MSVIKVYTESNKESEVISKDELSQILSANTKIINASVREAIIGLLLYMEDFSYKIDERMFPQHQEKEQFLYQSKNLMDILSNEGDDYQTTYIDGENGIYYLVEK